MSQHVAPHGLRSRLTDSVRPFGQAHGGLLCVPSLLGKRPLLGGDESPCAAGLVPLRPFTAPSGLTRQVAAALDEPRDPERSAPPFLELVRSRVCGTLAACEDPNDPAHRGPAPVCKRLTQSAPAAAPLVSPPTRSRLDNALPRATLHRLRDGFLDPFRASLTPPPRPLLSISTPGTIRPLVPRAGFAGTASSTRTRICLRSSPLRIPIRPGCGPYIPARHPRPWALRPSPRLGGGGRRFGPTGPSRSAVTAALMCRGGTPSACGSAVSVRRSAPKRFRACRRRRATREGGHHARGGTRLIQQGTPVRWLGAQAPARRTRHRFTNSSGVVPRRRTCWASRRPASKSSL
jgi:hypothetical protein